MNPKELRIGNLINRINRRNEVHLPDTDVLAVIGIGLCHTYALSPELNPARVNNESLIKLHHADVCCIPLRADISGENWLQLLGFKRYRGTHEWYVGDFVINAGPSYFVEEQYGTKIRSVHHLQNIFFAIKETELIYKP